MDTPVMPADTSSPPALTDTITFRELTFKECRQFLDQRTFASKEELLQLFYIIYFSDTVNHIVLNQPTIRKLHKSIHSYFPLRRCTKIIFSNQVLLLQFNRPLRMHIPGTWRQASLRLSRKIVFRVTVAPDAPRTLSFEIAEGLVGVSTTAFLRMFTPFAINVEGQALSYTVDEQQRYSTIGLKHFRQIPGDQLAVEAADGEVKVDARVPDLPDSVDLYFKDRELYYFGITIRLLKEGVIQCNKYRPEKKPEGYAWFKGVIDSVLADPEGKLQAGVQRTVRVTYNLEKKKVWFWQGFDLITLNH